MAYEKPAFCVESCVKFDQDFIDEICKMGEEAEKIRCGISPWSAGIEKSFVYGSDDKFYIANSAGDPANNDPVTNSSNAHWFGGFCSIGEALEWVVANAGGNNYVTGASVSGTTLTINRNGGLSDIVVTGLPSGGGGGGDGNNYVNGGSVAGTDLTLTRQGLPDIVISDLPSGGISPLSGCVFVNSAGSVSDGTTNTLWAFCEYSPTGGPSRNSAARIY